MIIITIIEIFIINVTHEFYYNKKTLLKVMKMVGLSGEVKGIHRYNFSNLLNWHINNDAQKSSSIAMAQYPISVKDKNFMKMISKNEENYKKYLESNTTSESLYFVGKFN